ncbi:metallophosphoesterase family protein [Butyrivibrio sp. INlla21]|uniref:metallophosphoesterase family protein n=1 Tax=Butyrivibrio sp. INlla21 TaxID=1520811 RepID=UPI0008E19FEE|nr:metallophosphoesterase family protein [Butyrivibrio sp. INlla21]SFU87095.1 Predicted phosphodiesterase [Butyrivibrio sp. INlla21]
MEDKYLILSDIHGNVSAFDAVLQDCSGTDFTGVILLGDLIDYGMRSNDIVQKLIALKNGAWKDKILVNIWGNHEKLVVDKDLERLSSDRGRVMAQYTARQLTGESVDYINESMNKAGIQEFELYGLKCLAVHGSLEDNYWKAIGPDNLRGEYAAYDLVFGGHSHYSHCFTHFYPIEDQELRNKKAVTFVNPGSVGQPRNQNPCAQYAVLSLPSKSVELRAVEYDIAYEQSLFPEEIDEFYKTRLTRGV